MKNGGGCNGGEDVFCWIKSHHLVLWLLGILTSLLYILGKGLVA
jgi:hypothetical protein